MMNRTDVKIIMLMSLQIHFDNQIDNIMFVIKITAIIFNIVLLSHQ